MAEKNAKEKLKNFLLQSAIPTVQAERCSEVGYFQTAILVIPFLFIETGGRIIISKPT